VAYSTPSSHTINRSELARIDIGVQFGHEHLFSDSACSVAHELKLLRIIQCYLFRCPTPFRHHIHRETLGSIVTTRKIRSDARIRTHLCKINTRSRYTGNDLAGALLANQVADGHPSDKKYTMCAEVTIGNWTYSHFGFRDGRVYGRIGRKVSRILCFAPRMRDTRMQLRISKSYICISLSLSHSLISFPLTCKYHGDPTPYRYTCKSLSFSFSLRRGLRPPSKGFCGRLS
jgi:hypothetical protein